MIDQLTRLRELLDGMTGDRRFNDPRYTGVLRAGEVAISHNVIGAVLDELELLREAVAYADREDDRVAPRYNECEQAGITTDTAIREALGEEDE